MTRPIRLILVLCLQIACSAVFAQHHHSRHPRLLLNAQDVAAIRNDLADSSWKREAWHALRKEADRYLKEPVVLPDRGGNWDHFYFSPTSGYQLERGKQLGDWRWEHLDPLTGQRFTSSRDSLPADYDGVVIGFIHDVWALGIFQLGLSYQISGDQRYADKAKEILLAYAALYPRLPLRSRFAPPVAAGAVNGYGKVHIQSLHESIWLTDMAMGADFVWDALTVAEQKKLTDSLFRPAANVVNDQQIRIHNMQCWKNTAVGLTGFLIGDHALINKAMNHPSGGYYMQLKNGFTREGIWSERSPGYHFYSLEALTILAQAARNNQYDPHLSSFHKCFRGPLLLASASKWIPALNDSPPVNLINQRFLYEWAYRQFKDTAFVPVVQRNREKFTSMGPRFTGWALLFGVKDLPRVGHFRRMNSLNFTGTGIGLLSAGQGPDNLTLHLKYHPWAGPHSHPDLLDFSLIKGDEHISIMPGASNYGSPLAKSWYQNTIAHNTLMVNARNHLRANARCIAFASGKGLNYIVAAADSLYDSVRFVRTAVVLDENRVLIVDQFRHAAAPQQFEILYHQAGKWAAMPAGDAWMPPAKSRNYNNYSRLSQTRMDKGQQAAVLTTVTDKGRKVTVTAVTDSPVDIITGYGKQYQDAEVPAMIFRRTVQDGIQAWCITLDGSKAEIGLTPVKDEKGNVLPLATAARITVADSKGQPYSFAINPQGLTIREGDAVSTDVLAYAKR